MASVLLAHALRERGIVVAALHPGWVQTDMGGPNATVPAADSVRGLLAVIDGLALEDSGSFRDWRGGARKSTRRNSIPTAHLVCLLLFEQKKTKKSGRTQ